MYKGLEQCSDIEKMEEDIKNYPSRFGEVMKYILAGIVALGIYYTGWTHGEDAYRQSIILSEEEILKLTEQRIKLIKQYVGEICKNE